MYAVQVPFILHKPSTPHIHSVGQLPSRFFVVGDPFEENVPKIFLRPTVRIQSWLSKVQLGLSSPSNGCLTSREIHWGTTNSVPKLQLHHYTGMWVSRPGFGLETDQDHFVEVLVLVLVSTLLVSVLVLASVVLVSACLVLVLVSDGGLEQDLRLCVCSV